MKFSTPHAEFPLYPQPMRCPRNAMARCRNHFAGIKTQGYYKDSRGFRMSVRDAAGMYYVELHVYLLRSRKNVVTVRPMIGKPITTKPD